MENRQAPGFDDPSVATDASIPYAVDDDDITVEPPPWEEEAEAVEERLTAYSHGPVTALAAVQSLKALLERVPAAAAGGPNPPASGSTFQARDSLGASADALDVIANPAVPGVSYLGVYHMNIGKGRFALGLAASQDLRTWRKIAALDATGGSMGTLRALPGGGFLLAYEAQGPTAPNGKVNSNVRLRFYRDPVALLNGAATEQKTLPRRLSKTNEGTPSIRSITWRGRLATSEIKLGFHYLDYGPKSAPRKLAVDREARGTLANGTWTVTVEAGIDRALTRLGFLGNHGARREFRFPAGGKAWRVYEAQKLVNVTGSWRVLLYDVNARTLQQLNMRTPGRSKSFANPTVSVLPSPHASGGSALVVTMFVFGAGAGPGESGELVYYQNL